VEAVERDAHGLRSHQRGGATVAEQQERQHLLDVVGFLAVQAAKLQVDGQHPGVLLRTHDMARQLERVHGRVASHEADDGALDRRRQAAARHQLEIEARRRKAGAARHHQMSDLAAVGAKPEPLDRGNGKRRGVLFVHAHARRRARQLAPPIEFAASADLLGNIGEGQAGIAVFDARPLRHAAEQERRTQVPRRSVIRHSRGRPDARRAQAQR
jgi:hypothetical protein